MRVTAFALTKITLVASILLAANNLVLGGDIIVTPQPFGPDNTILVESGKRVTFEARVTGAPEDTVTASVSLSSPIGEPSNGGPLATITIQQSGVEAQCTLTISHSTQVSGSTVTCVSGKTVDYRIIVPAVTKISVDPSDSGSHYMGEDNETDIIVTAEGGGNVKLKATALPNDQAVTDMLTWTGATVDENDKTQATVSRGAASKKEVDASISGFSTGERSASVYVLKVELEELGFSGDHKITKWSDKSAIDPSDSSPVWKKTGSPDLPVAYTKGSAATAFAKLKVTPTLPAGTSINATIRAKKGGTVLGSSSANLAGSEANVTGLSLSNLVPNSVKMENITLDWEISLDGSTYTALNSTGPITFYSTAATPSASPLFDFALENATKYIDGSNLILASLNDKIRQDLLYSSSKIPEHINDPLAAYDDVIANCDEFVAVLDLLYRSVRATPGSKKVAWCGLPGQMIGYRQSSNLSNNVTMQIDRPYSPHFAYHALYFLDGFPNDPSYGMAGWPTVLECVPGVSWQESDNIPSTRLLHPMICGH